MKTKYKVGLAEESESQFSLLFTSENSAQNL